MIDVSVLFLAMPKLSESLHATGTEQVWIGDIYGFVIAGFLVTMGTLGDRFGRKRVLLTGATGFGLASLLAAFSTSPAMLLTARALLGVAGATILPSTLALIMGMFRHPKQMGVAMAVWASSMMIGTSIGPVLGGALLDYFWWGSVFLIGVPIVALLLITGPKLLPEFRNPQPGKVDALSVLLSLAAIIPFVYGLTQIADQGAKAWYIVAVVAGVIMGVLFVQRQRRLAYPLLDLRLFAISAVSGGLVIGLLMGAMQGGGGFLVAQHLQLVEKLSPLGAGLWMLIPVFALVFGLQLTPGLSQKIKPAYILMGGMVIAAIGEVIITQVAGNGDLATLIVGYSIVFFGISPAAVLVNQVVMMSAPPERAGSAASLVSTGGELGVALGVAALGTIGVTVYRDRVVIPHGLPASETATIHGSIAGALTTVPHLPSAAGGDLLTSAREAFTSGLHTAAAVCVVVALGLAVISFLTLRRVPVIGPPMGGPPPEGMPPDMATQGVGAEGAEPAVSADALQVPGAGAAHSPSGGD
jgi:DHA2 family multidrug resistance protein-like MFS transporter